MSALRAMAPPEVPGGLTMLEIEGCVVFSFPLDDERDAALTQAERGVVALILEGRSNAAIAEARGTSVRTIANQVASIFKKLRVGSRAELVACRALFEA